MRPCYMSEWETDRGSSRQLRSQRLAVSFLPPASWANSAVCSLLLIKPLKQINKQSGAPVSTNIWWELRRRAFWHDDPDALWFGFEKLFLSVTFRLRSKSFKLVCRSNGLFPPSPPRIVISLWIENMWAHIGRPGGQLQAELWPVVSYC